MTQTYVYLSLFPESLVVSMLEPKQFGTYLAVGTKKRSSEHAIYFDVTGKITSDYFKLDKAIKECQPHPDGQPKHTLIFCASGLYSTIESIAVLLNTGSRHLMRKMISGCCIQVI